MSKHTPGLWVIVVDQADTHICSQSTDYWVATVVQGAGDARGKNAVQANAHLIAAAPDLLEVCERALSELLVNGYTGGEVICSDLRAAIEKAKGGTQ